MTELKRNLGFREGDVVWAYYRGLWIIRQIVSRGPYMTSLAYITKVASHRLQPCKYEERRCDVAWLRYPTASQLKYAISTGCILEQSPYAVTRAWRSFKSKL